MATRTTFPPHVEQFLANLNEVGMLLGIHSAIGGDGPGRRSNVEVLNKSAIVLTVACWEAYVEDLASAALEFMIHEANSHTAFPKAVLERVGGKHSGLNAWGLAGDGWKTALKGNLAEVLAKTTGALNTPRAANVDELFAKTLGLTALSSCWSWKGRTQVSAVAALDALITLRGGIAHRVQHSASVRKTRVTDAIQLVSCLAAKSTNEVRKHVHSRVGKYPWGGVSFNSVA